MTNAGPESVAVVLYGIAEGKISLEESLVPSRDGLYAIQEDFAGNFAILSPHGAPSTIRVLRSSQLHPASVYTVDGEIAQGIYSKLLMLDSGSETALVVPTHHPATPAGPVVTLVPVSIAKDATTRTLTSLDLDHFIFSGVPGGPEGGFSPVGRSAGGGLVLSIAGIPKRLLGLPPELREGHEGVQIAVVAASLEYAVLSVPSSRSELDSAHSQTSRKLFVNNRSTASWHVLNIKGNVSRSRLFGDWLTSIEESWHPGNQSNPGRLNEPQDVARLYRAGEGGFADIPGVLLLDNLRTGTHVELPTGEEDSEILKIEGNHLCYRIGNTIYEADIDGQRVWNRIEVAQADELRSVHWCFWR